MKILFYFLLLGPIISYSQQKEFSWLIGSWQETGKESFEVWKVDSQSLAAESYSMKGEIKKVTEEIKLLKKGNDFYYVPDVVGPQGSIEFKITSFSDSGFTAENPKHDFPTVITYKKIDEKHFVATIGNGDKTISYSFNKIK